MNSSALVATSAETLSPPFFSSCNVSSPSSGLSSSNSTRNVSTLQGSCPCLPASVMSLSCSMRCAITYGRLIGDQPVQSDLFDSFSKLVEIYWLLNVAVGAQSVAIYQVPLF